MVGKGRMDRDGISGSHCGMDISFSVAGALRIFQAKLFSERCSEMVETVISRNVDNYNFQKC